LQLINDGLVGSQVAAARPSLFYHQTTMSLKAAKEFLKFVDASPSPFHAVEQSIGRLLSAGFTEIYERDAWDQLKTGGKYFLYIQLI
jgi:aspartyl aminopeptidase